MSQEKPKEQGLNLTATDLKEIVKAAVEAAVAESRKAPELTEQQKAVLQSENDMRRQQAELVLMTAQNRRAEQLSCTHCRRDGSTAAVYIQDGNYMLCQHCQAIIRPGAAPAKDDGQSIYDTLLFSRLMQLQSPAIF